MSKCAVFLNGPVGSGKTSLGRAIAACNGAAFIDGDDLSDPNRPWFCSILQTSRAIVREGGAAPPAGEMRCHCIPADLHELDLFSQEI